MGRSSSKLLEAPSNPLEELQFEERKREQRKRKQEKQLKQIAKLQKKQAKRQNKAKGKEKGGKNVAIGCVGKSAEKQTSITNTKHASGSATKRTNSLNSQSTSYEINKEEFNRQIEQQIQNQLDSDLCAFVLNQVSLTLQFFGNYENHGPDKHHPQPLQSLAMYVIFENIDIARPNDANYDSISPLCKVDLDTEFYHTTPCKEEYAEMLRETKWKGYVRLKLREEPKVQRNGVNEAELYTDVSSGYSTTSNYSLKSPSTASCYRTESDYDYAYIAHLNTHHPLSELRMQSVSGQYNLNAKVLPDSCVASLAQFVEPLNDDDEDDETEDEDEEENDENTGSDTADEDSGVEGYSESRIKVKSRYRDYETVEAIRLYKIEQERRKIMLQQCYLNSRDFMRYFGELVRQQLAERLQIQPEELDEGTYRGSSIYTKYYELIPAIYVAHNAQHWPDCAFQFRIRERPIATNPLTGQKFQWPTRAMIRRIESFGFHVIPVGYAPKRQRNPFRELEWRIVFPKAERYLEQHLTHTQVKVFMMTKALVKTFVEPQERNKALTFTIDHLRMHLFWECERNFTAWPEEYLGEVLLRFISTFMQRLREKCLRDFFIEERNLFESIPEYSLVTLFSILADIVANPLMHLMVALKNLDFAEDFFPKLNYKNIFENLSENNMLRLKMKAKNSRSLVGLETLDDAPALMQDDGAKGLVGMKQHREKTNGKLRRKTHVMRHKIEMKKKLDYERRRLSVESIDVEFFFRRNLKNSQLKQLNQGVENLRRTNILETFIDHLIAMTEKAINFRVLYLAKSFLVQARRLCKFYNNYGCDMGAKEYLSTIDSMEEEISGLQTNDEFTHLPPTLPIRTSVETGMKAKVRKEVFEHLESVRRAVRVSVETTCSEQEKCKGKEFDNPLSKSDEEYVLERRQELYDNLTPSMEPHKSIKFIEQVAEAHQGDTNPLSKLESQSLVGTLRFNDEVTEICDAEEVYENYEMPNEYHTNNATTKHSNESGITDEKDDRARLVQTKAVVSSAGNETKMPEELEGRVGFAKKANMLRSLPLGNSQLLKDITSSTEKLLVRMASEEMRAQLKETIKQKTLQLKGAFNQSSET
ncbi:uncharacterized protein LOC105665057 isoform X2 [Ceratitis capitata]|uniref:uncharacterized protein LOC105665057 isoform X2 n=1 Tax=Ceratitis capitata TaxID=7213 RepID=UPI000A117684|nr:uncharacterized protein LOC105665057 isoform X2 [Ceratitis capitata]